MDSFTAGIGRRCITPPLGAELAGYAARQDGCLGVYDDLWVTAVALSDGTATALLLAFDLLSFNRATTAALKAALRQATGLDAADILLNTSHTHAGPRLAPPEPTAAHLAIQAAVRQASVAAALEALATRLPAELSVGAAALAVGVNRRERQADGRIVLGVNPSGPTLPEVTVWQIARSGGERLVLFSAPVHGVTMGSDNRYVSAEWMGAAVRGLERRLTGTRAVFLRGCAGDQNARRDRGAYSEVIDHGTRAALAVTQALADLRPAAALPLRVALAATEVPLADGRRFPVSCHGLRLGDAVLVGLGGEAFVEYALHGRRESALTSTMILGYTDACVGYLAVAATYAEGGYEAEANRYFETRSPWTPALEPLLKGALTDMLTRLGAGRSG